MLFLYYIILFLYVGLVLLYAVTPPETTPIPPWPLLPVDTPAEAAQVPSCSTDADCPRYHVCLGGRCVPKWVRSEDCNPRTGKWISYRYGGADFALCVCHKPELITQRLFGGDCDVKVGCGVHGTYDEQRKACQCDFGYEAVGLTCRKRPVASFLTTGPCEADEVEVTGDQLYFHPDYRPLTKCVKRPCSFDALTGKPLKRSRFEPDWGCVCDPRYGLFGASLAGQEKKYLKTPGYDACALLFREEPEAPREVELVTYFYLGEREPLSLVLFKNLSNLAPPFTGTDLMVAQKLWKYDYAQYFFKTHPQFRARQRYTSTIHQFHFVDFPVEWHYSEKYEPPFCHTIPAEWKKRKNKRVDTYSLLYWYPVCRMHPGNSKTTALFSGKMVTNPLHVTFTELNELYRGNAFSLSYDRSRDRWTVDLDHEYNPRAYQNMDTNAPKYHVDTTPVLYSKSGILVTTE